MGTLPRYCYGIHFGFDVDAQSTNWFWEGMVHWEGNLNDHTCCLTKHSSPFLQKCIRKKILMHSLRCDSDDPVVSNQSSSSHQIRNLQTYVAIPSSIMSIHILLIACCKSTSSKVQSEEAVISHSGRCINLDSSLLTRLGDNIHILNPECRLGSFIDLGWCGVELIKSTDQRGRVLCFVSRYATFPQSDNRW